MILEKRYLPFEKVGNVFKLVAEELDANVNTQIIIHNDILREIATNNCKYNVYFHNYFDNHYVSDWYTLHERHAFSPEISRLGVRLFCHNYTQVIRFCFRGYNFSAESYNPREFIFYEHEIQRILFIEVS